MWPALYVATALAAPSPETTEAALAQVNSRAPPMGYVFFLDTSEPMKATADGLRAEIAALAEVIPAKDSIEVITFHVRPYVALPRTVVTEAERGHLVETIRTLDLPNGYDRDLGAGLAELANELVAPGAPAFQHVFGVSTFCHAPPVLSAWSNGGRGCGPIRDQAKIGVVAAPARDGGQLSLHWFPVRIAATETDLSGAAAAMHELGGELVTDGAGAWLQNFRARLPATRPLPAANFDAHHSTFTATVTTAPDSTGHAVLTLRSSARVLDLALDHLVIDGAQSPGVDSLLLAPEGALPVDLVVPPTPWSLFPRTDTVDVRVTLTAQGQLEPQAALSLWGLDGRRRDLTSSVVVPVTRHYGLPLLGAVAVLVAAFFGSGLLSVFIRGKRMPLRLGGEIATRFRGGPKQALAVADRREAALILGEDGIARVGAAEEAAIILRVRRPLWNLYAEVQIRAKGAEINGRPVEPGVHAIMQGATSLRVGDWRVTWE